MKKFEKIITIIISVLIVVAYILFVSSFALGATIILGHIGCLIGIGNDIFVFAVLAIFNYKFHKVCLCVIRKIHSKIKRK